MRVPTRPAGRVWWDPYERLVNGSKIGNFEAKYDEGKLFVMVIADASGCLSLLLFLPLLREIGSICSIVGSWPGNCSPAMLVPIADIDCLLLEKRKGSSGS